MMHQATSILCENLVAFGEELGVAKSLQNPVCSPFEPGSVSQLPRFFPSPAKCASSPFLTHPHIHPPAPTLYCLSPHIDVSDCVSSMLHLFPSCPSGVRSPESPLQVSPVHSMISRLLHPLMEASEVLPSLRNIVAVPLPIAACVLLCPLVLGRFGDTG